MMRETETRPPSDISEGENRISLEALRNQIDFGQGGFVFLPVEYDLPSTLEWIHRELRATIPAEITLQSLELPRPAPSLTGNVLDVLRRRIDGNILGALLITGFERWFPEAISGKTTEAARTELARAIQPLNLGRNLLRDYFPCPFLLCLPTPAMAVFLPNVPDLSSWKAGYYAFHADLAARRRAIEEAAAQNGAGSETLSDLEWLLRDAEAIGEQSEVRARLEEQIGQARLKTGDRGGALSAFEAMASLAEQAGDAALRRRAEERLRETRRVANRRPAPAANALDVLRYFPGADSLSEQTGEIFGRERELQELIGRLTPIQNRFLILWGETGCGKSSLVRAGLIPRLSTLGYLPVRVTEWDDPERNCVEALRRAVENAATLTARNGAEQSVGEAMSSTLESKEEGGPPAELPSLRNAVRTAYEKTAAQAVVIICDQFERFFDLHPERSERALFLRSVAACVNDFTLACKFLLVVREDRLSRMTEFEFVDGIPQPLDLSKRFELQLFSEADAKIALREQADQAGLHWNDELIAELVSDLTRGERVRPIDLQIAATALALSGAQTLTDYTNYGRARGLIDDYVSITLKLLEQPTPAAKSIRAEPMQRVLLTLISEEDTPRHIPRTIAEIEKRTGLPPERIKEIIDRLALGRLVRRNADWVELVHDRLAELVLKATSNLQDRRRQADRTLRRAMKECTLDPRYTLGLSDTWFVRKNADPQLLQREEARRFLDRSLRIRLMLLGGQIAAVVGVIAVILLGIQNTSGYISIERDARERIVVRRGLPGLQFLPGWWDNSILLDTGYTWNDLDYKERKQQNKQELQNKVDWDIRIGRRHSDVIFASWFVDALKSPAEKGQLLLTQGKLKLGWQQLELALHGSDTQEQARAVSVMGQLGLERDGQVNQILSELQQSLKPSSAAEVRQSAVVVLSDLLQSGRLPLQDGCSLLIRALKDADVEVRTTAAKALGAIIAAHPDQTQKVIHDPNTALDQALGRESAASSTGKSQPNPQLPDPYGQTEAQARLSLERNTLEYYRKQADTASLPLPERLESAFPAAYFDYPRTRPILVSALSGVVRTRPAQTISLSSILLQERDAAVQSAAVEALGQAAQHNPQDIVKALLPLLKESDFSVQSAAAKAMGQAAKNNRKVATKEVAAALLLLLQKKDPPRRYATVQSAAAYALGQTMQQNSEIAAKEVVIGLLPLLKDADAAVQSAAVEALGQAAQHNPQDIVKALLPLLNESNSDVQSAAAKAMGQAAKNNREVATKEVVSALLLRLNKGYSPVQSAAAEALGWAMQNNPKIDTTEAMSALLLRLKKGDYYVQAAAAKALGQAIQRNPKLATTEVMTALLPLLESPDAHSAAAYALRQIAQNDPRRVAQALLPLLQKGGSYLQYTAAEALGQAMEQNSKVDTIEVVKTLRQKLKGGDPGVQSAAAKALGQAIQSNSKVATTEVVKALLSLLKGDYSQSAAAEALGWAIQKNPKFATIEVVMALCQPLKKGSSDVQLAAAKALGQAAQNNPQRVTKALLPLLQDTDFSVQSEAAYALGQAIQENSKVATPAVMMLLLQRLKKGSSDVQAAAAYALCQATQNDPMSVVPALLQKLQRGDPSVQPAAAEAIEQVAKSDPEAIAISCTPLIKMLAERDQAVACLALCLALQADFRSVKAQAALQKALSNPDPVVRDGALYLQEDAIRTTNGSLWDRSNPFVRALLDQRTRPSALYLLLMAIREQPERARYIYDGLVNRNEDVHYSAAAIVQEAAARRPEIFLPGLARMLRPTNNVKVQATALVLTDNLLNTQPRQMQMLLRQLMKDPNEEDSTRAEAAYLLKNLANRYIQKSQFTAVKELVSPLLDAFQKGGPRLPMLQEAASEALLLVASVQPNEVINRLVPGWQSAASERTRFNALQAILKAAQHDPQHAVKVLKIVLGALAGTPAENTPQMEGQPEERPGMAEPDPQETRRLLALLPKNASADGLVAYLEGREALPGHSASAVHTDAVYRASLAAALGQRLGDPQFSESFRTRLHDRLQHLRDDPQALPHLRLAAWNALAPGLW